MIYLSSYFAQWSKYLLGGNINELFLLEFFIFLEPLENLSFTKYKDVSGHIQYEETFLKTNYIILE